MRPSRLRSIVHYLAFVFAFGLGLAFVLAGSGVLPGVPVPTVLSDTGWAILLLVLGVGVLLIALHFLLVLADHRVNEVLFSRSGEYGRVEVSPGAVREFIGGILGDDLGLERYRVALRRQGQGVAIRVRTAVSPDQRVTDLGERIQRELTEQVADRTGVEVSEVTVFVRSIRRRDRDIAREGADELEG